MKKILCLLALLAVSLASPVVARAQYRSLRQLQDEAILYQWNFGRPHTVAYHKELMLRNAQSYPMTIMMHRPYDFALERAAYYDWLRKSIQQTGNLPVSTYQQPVVVAPPTPQEENVPPQLPELKIPIRRPER